MKKSIIIISILLLASLYSGCSDDTTSSTKKNYIMRYEKVQKNDTLILTFNYQDTAYTFLDTAVLSQFDTIPRVEYEVNPTNGYLDYMLYNNLDSNIFTKRFTGYAGNMVYLTDIPYRYVFYLNSFTGSGSIKVVK